MPTSAHVKPTPSKVLRVPMVPDCELERSLHKVLQANVVKVHRVVPVGVQSLASHHSFLLAPAGLLREENAKQNEPKTVSIYLEK